VPAYLFYYVTPRDANYWVNIDPVLDKKLNAGLASVSQFEPAVHKYRPDWLPEDRAKALAELKSAQVHRDGHTVEAFRYATEFNQF
jgi:hypothetical protein